MLDRSWCFQNRSRGVGWTAEVASSCCRESPVRNPTAVSPFTRGNCLPSTSAPAAQYRCRRTSSATCSAHGIGSAVAEPLTQGIKEDATQLIGNTPMVLSPFGGFARLLPRAVAGSAVLVLNCTLAPLLPWKTAFRKFVCVLRSFSTTSTNRVLLRSPASLRLWSPAPGKPAGAVPICSRLASSILLQLASFTAALCTAV